MGFRKDTPERQEENLELTTKTLLRNSPNMTSNKLRQKKFRLRRKLQNEILKEVLEQMTLCQEYDTAAKAAGYKDWNTLCALNKDLQRIIKQTVKKRRQKNGT